MGLTGARINRLAGFFLEPGQPGRQEAGWGRPEDLQGEVVCALVDKGLGQTAI